MTSSRRRHEVRDDDGYLVAVIDVVEDLTSSAPHTVELAADLPGRSYRVRVFNPAVASGQRRAA
jgi:hypothetical protein